MKWFKCISTACLTYGQVAHDVYDTFDAVFDVLEEVAMGLLAFEMYIGLFGYSDSQLLKTS